jgi:serine/threonine-protein kinase
MDPASQKPSATTNPPDAAVAGPEADLTGRTLGDFQVLRRLGQGGMGQVYLAEQLSLKRKVALKILKAELAGNPTSLKRFKAEAEAVARATHANIVQVYFIGESDGLHYMALEFVDGRNLREYVEKKGPPEVLSALGIIREVASALERAGELGIIHRDIKPENILLTRKGEAKVADFGLSRCFADDQPALNLTQSGVTMGTPLYMSPEQVEGRALDPRSDIYSFGVTCYFMLAGQPPYRGQTAFEVALKHIQGIPEPLTEIRPDLPPALCGLVHKMMARAAEDRFQTAREIVQEVAQLRDTLVGMAATQQSQLLGTSPAPAWTTPTRVLKIPAQAGSRRRAGWLFAASVVVALGLGGTFGWFKYVFPGSADRTEDAAAAAETFFHSRKEREAFLVGQLKRYAQPGEDRDRIKWGVKYAIELGLIYLEDRRLDEADRLFKDLDRPGQGPAYHTLGKLGQALVLAFQDRAEESNKLFLQLSPVYLKWGPFKLSDQEKLWYYELFRSDPHLRRMIARALDQNFDNAPNPQAFPRGRLNLLRSP